MRTLVKPILVHKRIAEGWSLEQALEIEDRETKYHLNQEKFTFEGKEYHSGSALARAYGVWPSLFHARHGAGWPLAEALDRKPRKRKHPGSRGKPVDCDGRHFPTIRAFAIYYDLDEKNAARQLGQLGWSPEETAGLVKRKEAGKKPRVFEAF